MYMTIRSQMSSIMDLIGLEQSELSALELENLPYLTLFTLYHLQILTNQYQTWPQYIYAHKVWVQLWVKLNQNIQSYLPLNLEKLLNLTVYTLASTNTYQSAPNLVKMYVIIRSRVCLIMDLIGPKLSKLSALELENLPYLTLFTL